MNDSELDDLIRRSHPSPDFESSFQREIWARIAIAEQAAWSGRPVRWFEAVLGRLSQPVPALAMVTAMLLVGAGLGRGLSSREGEAVSRDAYLASINPLFPQDKTIRE